eukprot:gene14634-17288_t
MLTFVGMTVGYATYYFTRQSFTYVAPFMRDALSLDLLQIGAITSVFPLVHGCSKFVGGTLADVISPRKLVAAGLLITGAINIAFGCSSTLTMFCILWGLNGFFQGFGAPPCSKLLTNWFPTRTRATWWGIWNTSHNIGGALIPVVAAGCAAWGGWRLGMAIPGLVGVCVSALVFVIVRDSPQDVQHSTLKQDPVNTTREVGESTKNNIKVALSTKSIWLLGAAYFFIYAIRQGVVNWSMFYLMDHGVSTATEAAARMSCFEIGGLAANITSGALADFLTRRGNNGIVGQRVKVMLLYLTGIAATLMLLKTSPSAVPVLQFASFAMLGHFIYGPQLLVAVAGSE